MADEGTKPADGTQPGVQAAQDSIPKARFDEVNRAKKEAVEKAQILEAKLAEIEKQKQAEQERILAEQGQYKELHEKQKALLEEAQRRATEAEGKVQDAFLKAEVRARLADIENAKYLNLFDYNEIKVEDGKFVGLEEAIAKFREENPKLFAGSTPTYPTGLAPHPPTAGGQFAKDPKQMDPKEFDAYMREQTKKLWGQS